jgi:DNA-binding MarR family transcriptional regulator
MSEDIATLTDFDRVLHSPSRLIIVTILSALKEADFLYLLNESGLTRGNLSPHLSRLEQEDYIEIEKTCRGKIPLTLCRFTETGQKAFQDS